MVDDVVEKFGGHASCMLDAGVFVGVCFAEARSEKERQKIPSDTARSIHYLPTPDTSHTHTSQHLTSTKEEVVTEETMFASRLPSAILRQMNAVAPFRPSAKCRPSPSNIMMHNRQNYISISALDTRVRHVYAYPTVRQFSSNESVTITYVDSNGDEHPVIAEVGHHLLDVAHNNNIELEGMSTKMRFSFTIS